MVNQSFLNILYRIIVRLFIILKQRIGEKDNLFDKYIE